MEKETIYNAGSGNTLAEICGNTYSGMTGHATLEYAYF